MTKKRYPKTARTSRSARQRHYPFERRYAALQGDDEHPVDAIIDRIPQITRLDRKLARMSKSMQNQAGDAEAYLSFEDLRLEQRCTREEAFFDAGHEQGRIDGATEAMNASVTANPEARTFAKHIRAARLASRMPPDRVVAVLLEIARGIVMARHR